MSTRNDAPRYTDHDRLSKSYGGGEHLVRKLGNKVSADGTVLTQLLLEPLRVLFKVLDNFIVGRDKYRCHFEQELAKMYHTTALVRSSHKKYTICRELDWPVFLQSISSRSIRVNESLRVSTFPLLESLTWTSTYTFDNYSSQAVGDEDDGTRLALCDSLAKWPISRNGSDPIPLSTSSWDRDLRSEFSHGRRDIDSWSWKYYGYWHRSPKWGFVHVGHLMEGSHATSWPCLPSKSSHGVRWVHVRRRYCGWHSECVWSNRRKIDLLENGIDAFSKDLESNG